MKAILSTYRQSPRKVRLIADLIRGKSVKYAEQALAFADKRSAPIILKLLNSAISNAKNNQAITNDDLFVKSISVDKGMVYKRFMPRARGSASRINKRTSHIKIELGIKEVKSSKEEVKKIEPKKVVKAKKVKTEDK